MNTIFGSTKSKPSLEASVETDGDSTFIHLSGASSVSTSTSIEGTAFFDAAGKIVSVEFEKVSDTDKE